MLVCTFSYFLFISLFVAIHSSSFFFFNDTATTEIYTLSLHDALPIRGLANSGAEALLGFGLLPVRRPFGQRQPPRSEEHTSELQSLTNLVCRLLLEKKKKLNTDDEICYLSQ